MDDIKTDDPCWQCDWIDRRFTSSYGLSLPPGTVLSMLRDVMRSDDCCLYFYLEMTRRVHTHPHIFQSEFTACTDTDVQQVVIPMLKAGTTPSQAPTHLMYVRVVFVTALRNHNAFESLRKRVPEIGPFIDNVPLIHWAKMSRVRCWQCDLLAEMKKSTASGMSTLLAHACAEPCSEFVRSLTACIKAQSIENLQAELTDASDDLVAMIFPAGNPARERAHNHQDLYNLSAALLTTWPQVASWRNSLHATGVIYRMSLAE